MDDTGYPWMKQIGFSLRITLFFGFLFIAANVPGAAQGETLVSQRPPGEGPTRIEISFYLIDLMKVNDADENFEADIFFLASWKDIRLAGAEERIVSISEVWIPNILVFNKRNISTDLPKVVTILKDGTVVYRQRLIGTFGAQLDLHRFPLDSQSLLVQLVNYGNGEEEVLLVESPDFAATRNPNLSIRDWNVGTVSLTADTFLPIPGAQALSRLNVRLDIERLMRYYIVQMLIPLILIVAMSWIPFWINPEIVPTRIGTCVTTVLTLIAYRFMFGSLVPKLPYLTLFDYLLFGATILVAASLITLSIQSKMVKDYPQTVGKIDKVARIAHPLVFVLMLAGAYFFS
jgi:hypothetical protein